MSSNLKTLSLEELATLAKQPTKEDELKDLTPIRRFIVSDGIVEGTYKIPASMIYQRYLKWCSLFNQEPVIQKNFFMEFKNYFNKVKIYGGWAYQMGVNGFDLSAENIQNVAPGYSRRNSNYVKNQKEQSKAKKERKNSESKS